MNMPSTTTIWILKITSQNQVIVLVLFMDWTTATSPRFLSVLPDAEVLTETDSGYSQIIDSGVCVLDSAQWSGNVNYPLSNFLFQCIYSYWHIIFELMETLEIEPVRNFKNKGSPSTMALDQFKRKEGLTGFHLFCFLTGIFLGN